MMRVLWTIGFQRFFRLSRARKVFENLIKPDIARILRAPSSQPIRGWLLTNVDIAPGTPGTVRTWVLGAENLTKPHLVCFARVGVRTVRNTRVTAEISSFLNR